MTIFRYVACEIIQPDARTLSASYAYRVGSDSFTSKIVWSSALDDLPMTAMTRTLAVILGFVEGLSYWKASFAPRIDIDVPDFPLQAQAWCREVLINGMAECAYRNGLLPRLSSTELTFCDEKITEDPPSPTQRHHDVPNLLLFSGGKDSLATRMALEEQGLRPAALRYEWHWSDAPSGQIGEGPYAFVIRRALDTRLRELNARGAINGHVPFSAHLALAGIVAADATGATTVFCGNTRSDDEPNVTVDVREINHQWSKSLPLENSLQELLIDIGCGTQYECPLRPFYELQIIRYLLARGVNLGALRTCNRVREGWCRTCAKCYWVYLAIAGLTDRDSARRMLTFEPDETSEALALLAAMAGLTDERPFECSGTTVEVRALLGKVYTWLLPPGGLRAAAMRWRDEVPLATVLGERGARSKHGSHDVDIVSTT